MNFKIRCEPGHADKTLMYIAMYAETPEPVDADTRSWPAEFTSSVMSALVEAVYSRKLEFIRISKVKSVRGAGDAPHSLRVVVECRSS